MLLPHEVRMARDSLSRMWRGSPPDNDLINEIQALARPLKTARDLDPLMNAIGDSRYVLLGEATHGTS